MNKGRDKGGFRRVIPILIRDRISPTDRKLFGAQDR